MKLLKLVIKNIKGVRDFTLETGGKNVSVYGVNGTGKSTNKDCLSWLLFDKSADDKKFNPKTVDSSGEEIPMLEHLVIGTFEVDGKTVKLEKLFQEKYTKKRGSNNKTFTRHETEYKVDDVPVPKKKYVETVESVADIKTFKLLSDVDYFSGKMPWKKRRELVMEICGDIADEAVIAGTKKLAGLTKILDGKTVEDYVTMIKATMSKINKEIKNIPSRIDEAHRSMFETESTEDEAKMMADEATLALNEVNKKISDAGADDAFDKLELDIRSAKTEVGESKLADKKEDEKKKKPILTNIDEIDGHLVSLKADMKTAKEHIAKHPAKISLKNHDIEDLTKEWHKVNDDPFSEISCPHCKREYDLADIEDMELVFNRVKSEKLEAIIASGKPIKKDITALTEELDIFRGRIDELEREIKDAEDELSVLNISYGKMPAFVSDKTKLLEHSLEKLEEKKAGWGSIDLSSFDEEKEIAETKHSSAIGVVEGLKNNKKIVARVEELKQQEVDLASNYEELEGNLFLTEEFTKTKVKMLETKVSEYFDGIRFKMFNQQINGGLDDCCEVMVDGVQYNHGLNNGAKINAGISIINTISKHFGANVPLIVDNAEASTGFVKSDSQIIKLLVSKDDDVLRVE